MNNLSKKERKQLCTAGMSLAPALLIGKLNITKATAQELENLFNKHELIKIKTLGSSTLTIEEAAQKLSVSNKCYLLQTIGKTALLYRKNMEQENT